jgi:predicted RNA binding protein YcfA (HicA-like mRNA interferase family)
MAIEDELYMPLSSREVIRKLEADGWCQVRQRGSHKHFRHPAKPGTATVPHPEKNLPLGTLRSIERQTGLKLR